jgi:hypothetical protein
VFKSRKDVEVHVTDLLTCPGSIRQKKINPLASNPALAQPRRHQHGHPKDFSAEFRSKVGKVGGVSLRHHEYVPRVHRLNPSVQAPTRFVNETVSLGPVHHGAKETTRFSAERQNENFTHDEEQIEAVDGRKPLAGERRVLG